MRPKKFTYYMADFETTVFEGQEYTEVWASAIVPFYTEDVEVYNSIDGLFEYLRNQNGNLVVFFHNLKFDGSFWLPFLIQKLGYKQAYVEYKVAENDYRYQWKDTKDMKEKEFKYSISDRGTWYTIIIKVDKRVIEIRDSLKLLPFSVAEIGKAFGTKHKKTDIEYKGLRKAGGYISPKEKEYIKNDVLVPKEALEIMFSEGHNKLTIGACCYSEYKSSYIKKEYEELFPNLYEKGIPRKYGADNIGEYVRKSYRGGWCYLVPQKSKKIYHNGITLDVNSLYPSMMSSESGSIYPYGLPVFWEGDYIPDECFDGKHYFFIRFRTRFYIKSGYLPFVQIKNNFLYKGNESLTTSDVWDSEKQSYIKYWIEEDGTMNDTAVIITMTGIDYMLFREHYDVENFMILDGCYFNAQPGFYDAYISKYKKQKQQSMGAKRTLAKLYLNNLYGKESASTDSSFKVAYVKPDGVIGFKAVKENKKKPGYIPCGSAITSYARNFTIRAAQKNYYGADKPGFIYADTDSLHMDIPIESVKGVTLDDIQFCCWKHESTWEEGFFTRQKTYIEKINGEYDIKCAGMQKESKRIFTEALKEGRATLNDFREGLTLPGRLSPKRIVGGLILKDSNYVMR